MRWVSSAGHERWTFFQTPKVMESGPGAAVLEERGERGSDGGGRGGAGKKCESRAWLMPSGVSWSGKERKRGGELPFASFLAVQTEEGDREERNDDQCPCLAFFMPVK